MQIVRTLVAALATIPFASAACGGKVVVDGAAGEGGEDGERASGVTSGPGPGVGAGPPIATAAGPTTTGPVSASSSTGPATTDPFVKYCDFLQKAGCGVGDTLEQCVQALYQVKFYSGSCYPAFDGLIDCYGENVASLHSCADVGPCKEFALAFHGCVTDGPGGNCHAQSCSEGSQGTCSCSGICFGGKVTSQCFPAQNGQSTCDCFLGGSYLGSCSAPQAGSACDLLAGCCAPIFGTESS